LILQEILAAFLQVVMFAFIPFLAYLFTRRRGQFLQYIGVYRPQPGWIGQALGGAVLFFLLTTGLLWVLGLQDLLKDPATVSGQLREIEGAGLTAGLVLLKAWIATALSEEILFRGFLTTRLSEQVGLVWGNTIQAIIFGLIHGALMQAVADPLTVGLVVVLTAGVAWYFGWMNQKWNQGSMIPSWVAHGVGNTLAFGWAAFFL